MARASSDIAFSQAVKRVQTERGSRPAYARLENRGGFETQVTDELRAYLEQIDTAFLATANADGQPYVQHRGGSKGFIRALDNRTLGFVDYVGNRQYVTTGNLIENDQICLILMDYARRRRVKVWGTARVVPADEKLVAALMPSATRARPEQVILISVRAWDANCPQHIPQKFDAGDVAHAITELERRIAELEQENDELRRTSARR